MFKVSFDIKVVIKDCPSSGLDCLDFRRKNGLPDDATNEVFLKCEFVDEQVCRTFPEYIDSNCDLPVKRTGWSNSMLFGKWNSKICEVMEPLEIPAEVVSRFLVKPDQNPIPMLDAIISEICRHIAKREENAREREHLEKEAKTKRDEENAKREQERVNKIESMKNWCLTEGSELLQERLKNGFEWENLFEQEYAESVFEEIGSGLEEANDYEDWQCDILERNTPTLEEIRFLKEVKTKILDNPATAELKWVKYENMDTDKRESRCELAVTVTCPTRREIVRYYKIN